MTRSSVKTVFSAFWDTFLNNYVVLVQAIGICPILAVGYTLKYAVALSVCTTAVLIPVSLLFVGMYYMKTAIQEMVIPGKTSLGAHPSLYGTAGEMSDESDEEEDIL